MKKTILMLTLMTLAPVKAQERVTLPFRDPSMPRQLVVDGMVGNVEITGYNGQEAIVESTGTSAPRTKGTPVPPGMRRIGGSGAGLDVTEENNVIRVSTGMFSGKSDLKIQVPSQTSVRVNTLSSGPIRIENINGEIEVQGMHVGDVNLVNVSGSVVANSMSKMIVSLNAVTPNKPMSFSTMNGDIDVTLPASLKANLKMKTQQGDIFTDFDMQVTPSGSSSSSSSSTQKNGGRGLRQRIFSDRTISATINGGGPEIQFTSFHGNILIHKK